MPTYYSPAEIQDIAGDILRVYSLEAISHAYGTFNWRGERLPSARTARDALCHPLQAAVRSRSMNQLLEAANEVNLWGFGRPISEAVKLAQGFLPALLHTLTAFDGASLANPSIQESSLAALLSVPDVGIATASKWICFMDQSSLGIFDSRVSIALRGVQIQQARAFPIMGRRPLVGKRAFRSDTQILSNPTRTARVYLDFLAVLSQVARAVQMDAAEVEMALFMLGDVWDDGQSDLGSLRRGQWK